MAEIKQVFIVELSTKTKIKIDADEVQKIMQGIAQGAMVMVRQGMINPSFVVAIVEDTERRDQFIEDTKYYPERRSGGIRSLKNIFENRPEVTKPKQISN